MSTPHVFLIRIFDRPWGFRVVAVVAYQEPFALDHCTLLYGSQSKECSKPNYAEVMAKCEAVYGNVATFTFQE